MVIDKVYIMLSGTVKHMNEGYEIDQSMSFGHEEWVLGIVRSKSTYLTISTNA